MTESANSNLALYKRLLGYTRPYWAYFLIAIPGFVLFSAMETAMAALMKEFLEALENKDTQSFWFLPVVIIVIRLLHGLGYYLGNFYIARVGLGVVNDLRKHLFSKLMYAPMSFFDRHNSGELVSVITYNIQQVTGAVTRAIKIILSDGLTIVGLLLYMIYLDWKLTLTFIIVAPILAGLVVLVSRYFRKVSRKMQVTMGGVTHIANETFQAMRLVKSYCGQLFEITRFDKASDEHTRLSTKYERVAAAQSPIFGIIIAIDMAVLIFLILWLWQDSVPLAVSYLTAAGMIAKPIRRLGTVNEILQKGLAAAESVFDLIDQNPEPYKQGNTLSVTRGKIEFKALEFSYGESGENVQAIAKLNLEIEAGSTVALVGRSGSGKTTLASLLMRFYEPSGGAILIDGQDIQKSSLHSLRQQIALVTQNTDLFNDSIAHNITYGSEKADSDRAKLNMAAKQAHALDFIETLPEQFDSAAGEDGARLSGGQRQRIAIARALFKSAPILILDEATSALDNESEKAIQEALALVKNKRTTLVIAHRLSTIEQADMIVVMEDGKLIEKGTHKALLEKNGFYAALHSAKFSD